MDTSSNVHCKEIAGFRISQEEMDALMTHMREEREAGGGVWRVDSNRLSVVPINILWSCVGGYRPFIGCIQIRLSHLSLVIPCTTNLKFPCFLLTLA